MSSPAVTSWPSCHFALGALCQSVVIVPSGFAIHVPLSRDGSSAARSGRGAPCGSRITSGLLLMKLNSEANVLPGSSFVARLLSSAPIAMFRRDGPGCCVAPESDLPDPGADEAQP